MNSNFSIKRGSFKYLIAGLFLALFSFSVSTTSAQTFLSGEDINVSQSSQYPGPGQNVSFSISSNSFNVNKADVSWYVNGTLQESGAGLDAFSLTVGPTGTETNLSIVVTTDKNITVKKDLVFRPAIVDLFFEPTDAYTPPFYKGKTLASHLSPVRVMAFANFVDTNGKKYSPSEIIYKWSVNDNVQAEASGLGRNHITFSGPTYHKSADVRVDAETIDGKFFSARQVNIKAQDPKIVFYENHPTLGLLTNRAYYGKSFNLLNEEVQIEAAPYYMSELESFKNVEYNWLLNGKALLPFGNRNQVILRNEGLDGTAVLSLNIYNTKKILQFAKNSLQVNFGTAAFDNIIQTGDFNPIGGADALFQEDKETFFGGE